MLTSTVNKINKGDNFNISGMPANNKIPLELASKILTVGPDYRNPRGGIGVVIRFYSNNFEIFKFISTYKYGSGISKVFGFLRALFQIFFKLLSDRKIKVIHIHGASYGSFYRKFIVFLIGKYLFRKKIVYHIKGGGYQTFYNKSYRLSKRFIKLFLRKADVIICLSQFWMEYFNSTYKTKELIILPNMIDYPEKQKIDKSPEVITFLFFGLITEAKGIFDLIQVIAANKNKYRGKIKLLIGGNGKVEKLLSLIKENEIEDIVVFLGWVNGEKKVNALNRADVYILPSYIEGSPVSILEAMSYGLPIISTKVGGIPELVKNKENGLLIDAGNLEQIEMALDWFVTSPELLGKYGAISEQLVQKHLPAAVLKKLIDVYQLALRSE